MIRNNNRYSNNSNSYSKSYNNEAGSPRREMWWRNKDHETVNVSKAESSPPPPLPLLGYNDSGHAEDWEVGNLGTLLATREELKFFRVYVEVDGVKESMSSGGTLHVPLDVHRELKQCDDRFTKYLLLGMIAN